MSRTLTILSVISFWFFSSAFVNPSREYHKDYYENGLIKSEGWINGEKRSGYWKFYFESGKVAFEGHFKSDEKEGYWYYYFPNGQLQKEGHYSLGNAVNWWIYYNKKGQVVHKCQLKNGIKNGYCLKYTDEKLSSAEKYRNGRKIDEWFNFGSFKRDNKLSNLR